MIKRLKRIILAGSSLFILTSFMYLNAQWARTYGGNRGASASSIQQTDDGGYIVGGSIGSYRWIFKLSPYGEIEWQKTYGGSNVSSIQLTRDGGYVIADTESKSGSSEFLILKLSSDGEIEWQKTYGGSEQEEAHSIQQTSDGGYIVAGTSSNLGEWGDTSIQYIWILKLSSEGDIEWQKTYGGNWGDSVSFIQQTGEGGYIVAGTTNYSGAGQDDIWIFKLSSEGEIEWQKTYGGTSYDEAHSVQLTNDGGYIVAGKTESFGAGGDDIWILKLSSEGDIDWQKAYGGSGNEEAHSICQTSNGGYIVAGSTGPSGEWYDYDCLVLKLSTIGEIEWQKTYGGSYASDIAYFIQQTDDGGYVVAGETNSWGGNKKDAWILKLASNGDINPTCAFIRSSDVEVLDTDISPVNTHLVPQDTDIVPQDEDITSQESDAVVYELCSEQCTLTLSVVSYGGTTEPEPGTYTYETGTEITLKATANVSEFSFATWRGNVYCDHNPVNITMDGDKSIEALFVGKPGTGPGGEGGEGGGGGIGCFIATAAYGSSFHSHVRILRDFRAKYLMTGKIGRKIVDIYYKYSPHVADLIAKHKALKVMVRINLLPIIAISYSILHFGPAITTILCIFIFILPVFFVWHHQRKLRRHMRRKKYQIRKKKISDL